VRTAYPTLRLRVGRALWKRREPHLSDHMIKTAVGPTAGGGLVTDEAVANELKDSWEKPVIIENRAQRKRPSCERSGPQRKTRRNTHCWP